MVVNESTLELYKDEQYPLDNAEGYTESCSITADDFAGVVNTVTLDNSLDTPPAFGNVSITNSTDVHFGNKTYYQGPVTIKQVLYPESVNENSAKLNSDCEVDGCKVLAYNEKDKCTSHAKVWTSSLSEKKDAHSTSNSSKGIPNFNAK